MACGATVYILQQHTSAYVSIRQYTSDNVSIRQDHTCCAKVEMLQYNRVFPRLRVVRVPPSAYVGIRQHMSACISILYSSI